MQPGFFPDFFIVGAPRCGTTSLSRYLARHRDICFSIPKENHYFSQVARQCSTEELQKNYLGRFFRHFNSGFKAAGEGSVSYLYSKPAILQILRFNPSAKIIAMVRNSIEMIHSLQLLLYRQPKQVTRMFVAYEPKQNPTIPQKKPLVKRLRKRLIKMNTVRIKAPPLDKDMKNELKAAFASDINRLEDLLGRALSHWK